MSLQMMGPVLIVGLVAAPLCALAGEKPDARLLRSGEFVYGDFQGEDALGRSRIVIARQPDGRYRGDRVSGTRHLRQSTGAAPVAVDDAVEAGVIDQRIDWASVMARKLEVGLKFTFQVYDPAIATSVGVAMVENGGRVHVPAGDFDTFKITYRIGKKSGLEQYVVFASKTVPRIMVREDFPDGVSSKLEMVASTP